jgi:murein L,D-transpeptidase YcbB/YkuD
VPSPSGNTPEQHVPLTHPVPVYITYLTASAQGSGIAFHDDFYSRDQGATRLAVAD